MSKGYVKPERLWLRTHPEYSEKWVQKLIADDPSIVGLGDLVLRDQERIHPRAGRLDLLLQDADTKRRYEVELQLGATDEAHIIRTIEYWDIERTKKPRTMPGLLRCCFSRDQYLATTAPPQLKRYTSSVVTACS